MPGITDLINIAPLVALTVGALVVIAVDLLVPEKLARPWAYGTSVVAVLLTGWYWADLWRAVQAGAVDVVFRRVRQRQAERRLNGHAAWSLRCSSC